MRIFKWNAIYSVYLPEIDIEHKELFKLGGELHRALAAGADPAKVQSLLHDVLEHINVHFAHEEGLMEETGYPSRGWHLRQHQTAGKKAALLVRHIRKGETADALAALEFLSSWLRDHTSVADKMMGAFLRNRRRLAAAS